MNKLKLIACAAAVMLMSMPVYAEKPKSEETEAAKANLCEGFGPQTPRDISNKKGTNPVVFPVAPKYTKMNLCNIHTHTNSENKGPGFSVFVNDTDTGGYACNGTSKLSEKELKPYEGEKSYKGVKSGDTIEVHWAQQQALALLKKPVRQFKLLGVFVHVVQN